MYNTEAMEARAHKIETVIQDDGVILFPGVKAGERVEVIVLHQDETPLKERPSRFGWLKGKVQIGPEFDAPIPGLEEYQ